MNQYYDDKITAIQYTLEEQLNATISSQFTTNGQQVIFYIKFNGLNFCSQVPIEMLSLNLHFTTDIVERIIRMAQNQIIKATRKDNHNE